MTTRIDHGAVVALAHEVPRGPHWHVAEQRALGLHHSCKACNAVTGLQVHHIDPFHYVIGVGRPDLEYDLRNLEVFCESEKNLPEENHHLIVAHGGNFKLYNASAREDAVVWFGMKASEIIKTALYAERQANRPKELKDMTREEKRAYRTRLDQVYPWQGSLGVGWPEPIDFDIAVPLEETPAP